MSDRAESRTRAKEPNPPAANADPLSAWRNLSNATLDQWAKAMVQLVNTDEYAKSSGAMLNAYLEASGPQKKAYEQMITRALAQSNMPSREDVLSLAERLTHLEMRIDDIDAKLDRALAGRPAATPDSSARASVKKEPAVNTTKPPRRRK